ncbi:TerB family tellurite resistance protein [Pedobacter sp. ASV28]|uniref:TerB family tellurite resistance protein n=1 Tax=Pedobacter sp. ASV28 TaxID=2795123 RepID=UPI00351C5110
MKIIWVWLLLSSLTVPKAFSQSNEAIQLGLNIEKLAQLKSILSNLKKGYDIIFTGYNTVKDISEGNFKIHQVFLDGLMEVSPAVKKYHKVSAIINYQVMLVKEYKAAFKRFKGMNWFNPDEITYMERVYDNLFKSSLKNLDELATVITANKLRMSDDERLDAIDKIFADMEDKLNFLRHFNSQGNIMALQRAKEQTDINGVKSLYDKKK